MPNKDYPLTSLRAHEVLRYALVAAMKEALDSGVLTPETRIAILDRVDEIQNALHSGKVVELDSEGHATIREADEEEAEVLSADPENFPAYNTAKKTLDI